MLQDRHGKKLTFQQVINKVLTRIYKIIVELEVYILRLAGFIPSHALRKIIYMMGGITFGRGSTIHMGARFYVPSNIRIGADTIIGEGVVLDGRAALTIGNHVDIASDVMIYNAHHDISDKYFSPVIKPVTIDDYVFIGPRVIILPGVHIKKGAVVGAGAVVTKDVEADSIVAGVPAKEIGTRKGKPYNYILGRADLFR